MKEEGEFIVLEPHWEVLCGWLAMALSQHAFDRGTTAPVRSLIETVRYLAITEPDALSRVLERLAD
jgi:hypothetical protein